MRFWDKHGPLLVGILLAGYIMVAEAWCANKADVNSMTVTNVTVLQGPGVNNFHWPFSVTKGDPITEEQCSYLGGGEHFWRDADDFITIAYQNTIGQKVRICRLCGKIQRQMVKPMEIQWEDVK